VTEHKKVKEREERKSRLIIIAQHNKEMDSNREQE
jgi:hypothetical protein